jgi:signal transduction histidine kinase
MRVLVVDDDPVQRQMAAVALRMGGHVAVTVGSGDEALRIIDAETFDVLLLDHEMPGMSGFGVMMGLRERRLIEQMPVLYVTSRDDIAVIDRAFELGASGFVTKPVNWSLMQHELRFVVRAAENERGARAARDQALKLAQTRDQMLNVVRHELRSPLNAVIGFGRLLRERQDQGSDTWAQAEEIVRAGEKLDACVSDMMLCLDLQNGRVTADRAAETLADLIDANLPAWRRRLGPSRLDLRFGNEAPAARLLVDVHHVTGIVERCIDNAVRHARSATTLLITVRRAAGDRVELLITDDGVGMPPDAIQRANAAFAQADMSFRRESEGLGLGLHIMRGLAALNGLTLDLRPGPHDRGLSVCLSGGMAGEAAG